MINLHFTRLLPDEAATQQAGGNFAKWIEADLTVYLHGDLGAGKTTFVRGVLKGLGHVGKVKSPTYTLVEPYMFADKVLYHFDLYRFMDKEEWEAAGFREYFNGHSICMIEWPEKALQLIPQADIEITLRHQATGRLIEYNAKSEKALRVLNHLEKNA